jgi:hypothetical protein
MWHKICRRWTQIRSLCIINCKKLKLVRHLKSHYVTVTHISCKQLINYTVNFQHRCYISYARYTILLPIYSTCLLFMALANCCRSRFTSDLSVILKPGWLVFSELHYTIHWTWIAYESIIQSMRRTAKWQVTSSINSWTIPTHKWHKRKPEKEKHHRNMGGQSSNTVPIKTL